MSTTFRRDIVSAYLLTALRVLVAVIIAGYIYRMYRPRYFATYNLVRGTILLLNYASFGLLPAMIHQLAVADQQDSNEKSANRATTVIATGYHIAAIGAVLALILVVAYRQNVLVVHHIHEWRLGHGWTRMLAQLQGLVFFFGLGVVLRVLSEPAAAILQTRGHIARDNLILATGEILWLVLALWTLPDGLQYEDAVPAAIAFFLASIFVRVARGWCATQITKETPAWRFVDRRVGATMMGFGITVFLVQVAEYLYAPIDFMLINWFLGNAELAAYAGAVQIDAGLLLLVTALGAVLLPKSALAHAAGNRTALRRYYVLGTLTSAVLLTIAAFAVWLLAAPIFRLWLGDSMPLSRAILPLVLIHTVVGGSSVVGRSILLGMGRVGPFAASVLIAGGANVILSYLFVAHFGLGLRGIIYGTLIAVTARCAIWMPWYVMRTFRRDHLVERVSPSPNQ